MASRYPMIGWVDNIVISFPPTRPIVLTSCTCVLHLPWQSFIFHRSSVSRSKIFHSGFSSRFSFTLQPSNDQFVRKLAMFYVFFCYCESLLEKIIKKRTRKVHGISTFRNLNELLKPDLNLSLVFSSHSNLNCLIWKKSCRKRKNKRWKVEHLPHLKLKNKRDLFKKRFGVSPKIP